MQAAVNEEEEEKKEKEEDEQEEEEEERSGCGSQAEAQKGRRSFVIWGEAGHKQLSQLPGLLIQHPQIKPRMGRPVTAAQEGGCISLAFLSLWLGPPNHIRQTSPSPLCPLPSPSLPLEFPPQAGNKSFLLVPVFFTECINCF